MTMKIALASDHRGFRMKNNLADFLKQKGFEICDYGTFTSEPCDYPDYTYMASDAVRNKKADRAIIICYTGEGTSMVANKVRGIRASLVYDLKSACLARRHNNANVLVLPSYLFKLEQAKKIVLRWLKEEFEGGRHLRRIRKIREIEELETTKIVSPSKTA